MPKVFVFGLDGATFDLILPWVAEGKLPHFARLLAEGSWSPLESVPNMRSPAAWTSFMTGQNPGKHGIFEFYEPVPQTYGLRFVHGGMRKSKSLWTLLSEQGKRVGVINVPMTYPAETVNGFLIAGLDAPGVESSGFCYPPQLMRELQERFGPYILEPGLTGYLIGGKLDLAVQKLREELAQKEAITTYLMQEYPWDFFMVVFRSLDAVQHCFWKFMDPLHPQHNPDEAARYGTVILETYQQIDQSLGKIWAMLDEETVLLVMSDHGFGRKHPANNQLNHWLASQGFLHYTHEREGKKTVQELSLALLKHLYRFLIGKTPRTAKEKLARWFPQLRNRVQSRLCFAHIDWSRTKAYSDTLFPNIWINLIGREAQGTVSPEEYGEVIDQLRQALAGCRDAVSGRRIVERVFHRDELYSGPYVEKAPDLLIRWKEDEVIQGIALPDQEKEAADAVEETRPLIPGEDPRIISGDHRLHGVLLMAGPPVRRGVQLAQARLIDLAPTILALLDLPIPADMDGRVLEEAWQEEMRSAWTPSYRDAEPASPPLHPGEDYSKEEEEEIAKRLRDLGYLD